MPAFKKFPLLANAVFSVKLMDGTVLHTEDFRWHGGSAECCAGKFDFKFSEDSVLAVRYENNTGETVFLRDVFLDIPPVFNATDYLEYTHSLLFLEQQVGVKKVGLSTPYLEHNPESHMLYMLKKINSQESLFFGALPPCRGEFLRFQAVHESPDMSGKFGVRIRYEEKRTVVPGKSVQFTDVLIRKSSGSPLEVLSDYGDLFAKARKNTLKPCVSGWNSWDEIRTGLTPENALPEFSAIRHDLPNVRYCILDDGWEKGYGLWEPNMKFRSGMADFCRKVRAEGGIPGVWTAPLCLDRNRMGYPAEWVLYNKLTERFVLDITRPEVLAHISGIYRELRAAGFEYFKVDFTNNILPVAPEAFFDRSAGHAGMLMNLYRTIREAIGDDTYLLGCCVPYEPAFGFVDSVRTTADIQVFWSAVQYNMGTAAARWWMHRKLWNADPDFLVVRGPETAIDFKRKGRRPYTPGDYASGPCFSETDAATLALAVYMTGGDIILSDLYTRLNDKGKDIIKRILNIPALENAAVPVDLFENMDSLPAFWFEKNSKKLAVFNWSGQEQTFFIDEEKFGIPAEMFFAAGSLTGNQLTLPPHASAGIQMA